MKAVGCIHKYGDWTIYKHGKKIMRKQCIFCKKNMFLAEFFRLKKAEKKKQIKLVAKAKNEHIDLWW